MKEDLRCVVIHHSPRLLLKSKVTIRKWKTDYWQLPKKNWQT